MSQGRAIKVLGISGSLRKASFNTMTLRAACELAPDGMTIATYNNLAEIPPYNDDVRLAGYPPVVQDFRNRLAAAEALVFVTPEYNHSISGVLKNAIDWASRPPDMPFDGKPAAIMGASRGVFGTARAQEQFRNMLASVNVLVVNEPKVMLGGSEAKFDAAGKLTDPAARDLIAELLAALRDLTLKLRG